MVVSGLELRRLQIDPELRRRVIELTRDNRMGKVPIPSYIGRPQMGIICDSHAEVETYVALWEALPSSVRYGLDLGDKVDRGEHPVDMNFVLQTLRTRRALGNHDAMWLAAGLGIPSQAIELIRWLLRYNEIDLLTSVLGVNLKPLSAYAEKYFSEAVHRLDVKSKKFRSEEAAATYLKIIAEAPIRYPEYKDALLNDSELRVRKALFFKEAVKALTPAERDIYDRLTGDKPLGPEDQEYFYKLVGGLHELNEEEQAVIDHFSNEFLANYAFYQFTRWMVGDGDLYFAFRTRQGYPVDILATHATIPVDKNGELAEFLGKFGRDAMLDMKKRIQIGMEAWRQMLEHGDPALMQMHKDDVAAIGLLPWDRRSPLYARQMQTAARAVLKEETGTWEEPEEPFYTHFEKNKDPEMVARARQNIADSFGFNKPDRYVIVRGHKPSKDGMFQVLAGGTVINIDGGMAKKYNGKGGALVFGTQGAAWLAYPGMQFTQVPLPQPKLMEVPAEVRNRA